LEKSDPPPYYAFVYGTLKRGYFNYEKYLGDGAEFGGKVRLNEERSDELTTPSLGPKDGRSEAKTLYCITL